MDELQSAASSVIADVTGAQAGCVTDCSAAGVGLAVAAAITGCDLALIDQLPVIPDDVEKRVLIQMGHMIHYGGPVPQMISISGAQLEPLGTAALCEAYHLESALKRGCAAAVYVVSHHTVREGELPMDLFIDLCDAYDTPVIVDMASEYDMRTPIELGASAVVYSGHKFMSGITSGVVAGRLPMVRAIYLQHRGLGRLMKVGKESIAGAMAALELWRDRDESAQLAFEKDIVNRWLSELTEIPGVLIEEHADWTGNPITRLKMTVDPSVAGLYAWELAARLADENPRIFVRDDLSEHGELYLDPCNVTLEEAGLVARAISEQVSRAMRDGDGCQITLSQMKRERSTAPLNWPK